MLNLMTRALRQHPKRGLVVALALSSAAALSCERPREPILPVDQEPLAPSTYEARMGDDLQADDPGTPVAPGSQALVQRDTTLRLDEDETQRVNPPQVGDAPQAAAAPQGLPARTPLDAAPPRQDEPAAAPAPDDSVTLAQIDTRIEAIERDLDGLDERARGATQQALQQARLRRNALERDIEAMEQDAEEALDDASGTLRREASDALLTLSAQLEQLERRVRDGRGG